MEFYEERKRRTCFAATVILALIMVLTMVPTVAQPEPSTQLISSGKRVTAAKRGVPDNEPDTLLVMLNSSADKEEVATALREVHGTVLRTIGSGAMTTLVVQAEPGQIDQVQKKLSKDSAHFSKMQRNPGAFVQADPVGLDDPGAPSEWHLAALKVQQAWSYNKGAGGYIAVADSGCQANNADLAGKTCPGMDVVTSGGNANIDDDLMSHGTTMATIAMATANNKKLTAGISGSYLFPVKVTKWTKYGSATTDEALIQAVYQCGSRKLRVLNVSIAMNITSESYANKDAHPVLHEWLKWYHDSCNGTAVFAAGNKGLSDPSPLCPYIIMCSGVGKNYKLWGFSNYGSAIWFTGPAESIWCSNKDGRLKMTNGTSATAAMISGLFALAVARYPSYTNKQLESLMINCCQNTTGRTRNDEFGYGMPNAEQLLSGSCSRGIGDEETEETKAPVYEGPEFEIAPIDPADIKFDDSMPKPES